MSEWLDTLSTIKLAGFDFILKPPTCLTTLKSCDTAIQSLCGRRYIRTYVYVYKYEKKDFERNLFIVESFAKFESLVFFFFFFFFFCFFFFL